MGIVTDGSQRASTVSAGLRHDRLACRWPVTVPDRHTFLARSPPYHPIRNAVTVNERPVVDAYSVIGSPGSTLACPA